MHNTLDTYNCYQVQCCIREPRKNWSSMAISVTVSDSAYSSLWMLAVYISCDTLSQPAEMEQDKIPAAPGQTS